MEFRNKKIYMVRGDSESFTVRLRDKKTKEYKDFVTGDTVYFTVKKTINDTDKELQKVAEIFDEGKAVFEILPEDTKEMAYGDYVYDVQLTDTDGRIRTILKYNTFTLEGEVTYE